MHKDPTGLVISNLLTIRGIENSLADEVNELIEALYDDIAAQIARIDPTGVSETYRAARLQKLMAEIEGLSRDAFDEIEKLVRQRAAEVGSTQADFAERVLRTALSGVAVTIEPNRIGINLLKAILDEDPIQGHLLRDWFRGQRDGTVFKVRREIQLGMVQNETIDDMVRRVRGTRVGFRRRDPTTGLFVPKGTRGAALEPVFRGGVMQTTTREATAIVRTAVTHISNVAHLKTYDQNADILTGVEYVSVLDSRTSDLCISLDGTRWPLDSPDIRIPGKNTHIGCRSHLRPILDWQGLGIEPPPESTRASAGGQVPASTRYDDWLRDQSVEEQNKILGPGRAQLFRAGKLNLRDLVRTDNSRVPLDELKRRAA